MYATPFDVDSIACTHNFAGRATRDLVVAVPLNFAANEIQSTREQMSSTIPTDSRSTTPVDGSNRDPLVRVALSTSGDSGNNNPRTSLEQNLSSSQPSLNIGENANARSPENSDDASMQHFLTQSFLLRCNPIRRVRHAEVVLVDDVCIAYDRYWLRLRWPGTKGGFAGYIAMGRVSEYEGKVMLHSV